MADEFRINEAELRHLLQGESGEVMQELRTMGRTVERGARRRTTPRIAAGVRAKEPQPDGVDAAHVDIETAAEDERGAPIGLYVEVGTAPHVIESHGDYPLRSATGRVFGRRVNHPGTRAQPHLRPALYEDVQ